MVCLVSLAQLYQRMSVELKHTDKSYVTCSVTFAVDCTMDCAVNFVVAFQGRNVLCVGRYVGDLCRLPLARHLEVWFNGLTYFGVCQNLICMLMIRRDGRGDFSVPFMSVSSVACYIKRCV